LENCFQPATVKKSLTVRIGWYHTAISTIRKYRIVAPVPSAQSHRIQLQSQTRATRYPSKTVRQNALLAKLTTSSKSASHRNKRIFLIRMNHFVNKGQAFREPKKSCANRSTVWFTESPGGLTAGAFVYKGQESRLFASTASREHRPPASRSRAAEITSPGISDHSRPRLGSPRLRMGREHRLLVNGRS
jgi:hypothetical protein